MNGNKTLTDDIERRQAFTYDQPRRWDGSWLWLGLLLIVLVLALVLFLASDSPASAADDPAPATIEQARTVCGWYTFHRGGRTYKRLICRQLPPPAG